MMKYDRNKDDKRDPSKYGCFPGKVQRGEIDNLTTVNGTVRDEGERADAQGTFRRRGDGVYSYEPPVPWGGNRTGEGPA
jgi:hypothetical protein